MPRTILVATVTKNYLDRACQLIDSINSLELSFESFVMTVDFNLEAQEGEKVKFLPMASLAGHRVLQQGQVVDYLDVKDDDVVIMADADTVIQRDLTSEEIEMLHKLDDNSIAMAYNAAPWETGTKEYTFVEPGGWNFDMFGIDLDKVSIYNCGLAIAKPPAWRKLRPKYEEMWDKYSNRFNNWRSCQLIQCVTIYLLGMKVLVLGGEIHGHQIFGRQHGQEIRDGVLYQDGKKAFLAHHVPGII